MKPDARKDNGGARKGAGRKPNTVPTKAGEVRLTAVQWAEFRRQDGSPWLQGILNLLRTDQPETLTMLLIDDLTKKHGSEFLAGLARKINERVAHELGNQK
jgi:hypothetical protein